MPHKFSNRLAHEKSPYLLQHADNPVDWFPWGEEAFEKAEKEDKPIFLSIGYSTCHWCHVMEYESFADPEVARLLNEAFVCIKVDREERPDIDDIYMAVCQMLTGSGGWPLTIVMTPDKKPFFAATYIPRENRFGRLGLMELIPRIQEAWETRRNEVLKSATEVAQALSRSSVTPAGKELESTMLDNAYQLLSQNYDATNGGFGKAPKFPTPHNLLFLLRYWKRSSDERALAMVEKTLLKMRLGGIYDHIGFGFHRYSTDPVWRVPHFEKMLYDQAMLVIAYTEAFQATGKEIYKRTAQEILTYVLRDMTSPEGGFYSAEDADSEGEEGKFYLWSESEIRKILDGEDADLVIRLYHVTPEGNFQEEATHRKTGRNILYLSRHLSEWATVLKIDEAKLSRRLELARQKLFKERESRIHPLKDDKILTDWNGLMIAALTRAGCVFDEPRYTEAAHKAIDFILEKMNSADGQLWHRYRDGEAGIPAYLDDYAFLIWGFIEFYETTFDAEYLKNALRFNEGLLNRFWDEDHGGFYFTANDGEQLLVRRKEIYDGAVPSGNSVAMWNLLRLSRLTGNAKLESLAARLSRAFAKNIERYPTAYTMLLCALDFAVGPSYELVVVGGLEQSDTRRMLQAIRKQFIPNKVVILRPLAESSPEIDRIAPFLSQMKALNGKATAYVCINYQCELPTNEVEQMLALLGINVQ